MTSRATMLLTVFLSSLLVLQFSGTGSADQDTVHYAILAPTNARVSTAYKVTATCYDVTSTVHLKLRLASTEGVLVESEAHLESGVTQIVTLQMPDDVPETQYTLYADGSGGLIFNNSHAVSITRKSISIFVQTDKVLYKPGQTVLFRVIVVHPDLKPYQGSIDIDVFDLSGNKIMQWKKQSNDDGVISQKVVLSDQTPLGEWKIVVNAGGNSATKTFEVAEYVLPKVDVEVKLPFYFLLNTNNRDQQDDLTITVIAKYTYGQPVKGRAAITVQVKSYGEWDTAKYNKQVIDVELVNGKTDVTLTIKELLALAPSPTWDTGDSTPDPWQMLAYRTLIVVADVNETVTGVIYSENATVDIRTDKYQLQFLDSSPSNFKPGLPYTAFLQLSQSDGSAPDLADITLSKDVFREIAVQVSMEYPPLYEPNYTYIPPTTEVINVPITTTGFMKFSLMIESNVTSVNFQPSFNVTVTNSTIYGYKYINAFKSRDNQTIQVSYNSDDGLIKADQYAIFTVKTSEPITVFQYEVLSKGNIILSDNVVGSASTVHSLTIWISKQLALECAPSVKVVVWFVTAYGEFVADSTVVSVKDIFANKVSISFDRNSTTPSENVSLTINAYPGSYVGLLCVDMSVLLLKSGNDVTDEMVISDLEGYETTQDVNPGGPIMWMAKRRKRSIWWPRIIDGTDSSAILSMSGLFLLSDGYIKSEPPFNRWFFEMMRPEAGGGPEMADAPGAKGADAGGQDSTQPRKNFPETWLWSDMKTGPDGKGTMEVTAPDTITSWILNAFGVSQDVGLGIAEDTAQLTVFKQFFISTNLPYSVIRGEEIALQVTAFNYLSNALDVLVTLKESNYYKVQGSTSRLVRVNSNDAVSVYFWIIPDALGQIPISISARSPVAGDAVEVMLLVKPEGVRQEYSTSTFIQLSASGSTYNLSFPISLPPTGTLVPGSEYIEVTVIGDLMGPSVNGLDNLLQMPSGCGEQNMLNFAPDVYIVKYLTTSGQLTESIKSKALGFMNAGYQTELTYQRSDGSFSAFGNSDSSGSVWLSALVIDVFRQADEYIPVDDGKIAQTMQWIISNQAGNGSFAEPPEGRVIHTDMQGGSSQGLPLTAYVYIALLQNKDNSQVDSASLNESIALAQQFLEDQVDSASSDPYALSIIAYAFSLTNSPKLNDVLAMLESLAIVKDGTKHWEKSADEAASNARFSWEPPYSQARAINIEMTAYVLRAYCQLQDISTSLPIVKWLIAQRNANGGFSSTQDTVVTLAGLAEFADLILGPASERSLQVSLATATVQHSFTTITDQTAILLQSYELPPDTKQVNVTARGKGAVLVQLNVRYNVYKEDGYSGVDLNVNTTQNGDNKITVTSCGRWTRKEGSGMVVMEINDLTGYEVSNPDDLKSRYKDIKRVEYKDGVLVLYFDELTSKGRCVDIISDKVFPVSKVKDAPVKAYPYYDPFNGKTSFYGLPDALSQTSPCKECPQCCVENDTTTPKPADIKTPCSVSPGRNKMPTKRPGKPRREGKESGEGGS